MVRAQGAVALPSSFMAAPAHGYWVSKVLRGEHEQAPIWQLHRQQLACTHSTICHPLNCHLLRVKQYHPGLPTANTLLGQNQSLLPAKHTSRSRWRPCLLLLLLLLLSQHGWQGRESLQLRQRRRSGWPHPRTRLSSKRLRLQDRPSCRRCPRRPRCRYRRRRCHSCCRRCRVCGGAWLPKLLQQQHERVGCRCRRSRRTGCLARRQQLRQRLRLWVDLRLKHAQGGAGQEIA